MNCVNPPLAGSRSLAAVILLPRFFSVPNLKAFCADFCAFKCAAQGGSPFPRTVRPCVPLCARLRAGVECDPPKPIEASVAAFVGDVRKIRVDTASTMEK